MAQDAIINRWDINGDVYDIQDAGRGRPLGVATLDENGRVPYTQLPESAVEFKGYWNADTNTPTLHDGTGTKGDLYYVDVAGTQDLGSGSQTFKVGDRVLYDGSVWKNISSGTDPVDIVEDGNMNPVTSNAVANYIPPINIDNIRIGSAQAKINTNQLLTWLISTKGYIPYDKDVSISMAVPWDYAGNDILQIAISGQNFELQLAGCIIVFMGKATSYNEGRFRLLIYTSPTTSFTLTSGYLKFPVSSIAEYTCNGSAYAPTWTLVGNQKKMANSYWGMVAPDGDDNAWIRTTNQGIIPYQSGGKTAGHNYVGTSSWYFYAGYFQNMYVNKINIGSGGGSENGDIWIV